MLKILKYLLLISNTVLVLMSILAYLSPYVHPEISWIPGVAALFFPFIIIGHLLCILGWILLSRFKFILISVITMLVGWNHLAAYVGFRNSPEISSNSRIMVMSYNLQGMQVALGRDKSIRDETYRDIFAHLTLYGVPDIICVQDYVKQNEAFFNKYFDYKSSYVLSKQRVKTGIFSKFPILKKGDILFEKSFNSCVWADIAINEDTIRVYSMHLESNNISDDTEEILSQDEFSEENIRKKFRGMLRKYKSTSAIRAAQANIIAAHIAESPYPVVLGGDLNDTPLSHVYRELKMDLQDTFRAKGRGLGTTYAGGIPGLRIDYIFASKSFKIHHSNVLKKRAFSDHYPVIAHIEMTEQQ
jgi:exonuclease III